MFVEATASLVLPGTSILSIIHQAGIIPVGGLAAVDHSRLASVIRDSFARAEIPVAVLGMDASVNEHVDGAFGAHWALHYRGHFPAALSNQMIRSLREHFPRGEHIARPLVHSVWDGDLAGLAYSMKADFRRRQSYPQRKWTSTGFRECQNTRGRPLRGSEAVELAIFLDRIGLRGRLLLHGAVLVWTRGGRVTIRPEHGSGTVGPDSTYRAGRRSQVRHTKTV